jgi:hypothetical protein
MKTNTTFALFWKFAADLASFRTELTDGGGLAAPHEQVRQQA